MEKLKVIKIGGNVIDNPKKLEKFLADFALLEDKKILVHGGGKIATELGKKLGIEAKMVDGRRITDEETLKLVTMVYAGLINKNIVAKLQSLNCNAIGLTGAHANCIPSKKRAVKEIDYGFVGDPESSKFNVPSFKLLLEGNLSPVIAPITHDGNGNLLNTNADTIASSIAVGLSSVYDVELIYCFEKNGVLSDPNNEGSVITNINSKNYEKLKSTGVVSGGMLPKLDNTFSALKQGVKRVYIGNSKHLLEIVKENTKTATAIEL